MTDWKLTLAELVQNTQLHPRFLNTLSLLEYIGARKIMKSQDENTINPTVLGHIVEEIRHAQILKKLALKTGGEAQKTYAEEALLCGQEGRDYIQAIDRKAEQVLGQKDTVANYLLTTLIIEERAQDIYPLYDDLLRPLGLNGPLKAIVREEEEHLAEVTGALKYIARCTDDMINQVRLEEQKYFNDFFVAVDQELKKHNSLLKTEDHARAPM